MKNTFLILFLTFVGLGSQAQDFPQPSPKASASQVVGVTEISIEYSSPGVKGRKIFGELVPYGQLWRTGANKATIISFADPVMVGGKNVDQGSYSVFTIPYEDGKLLFVLNSETELWGTGNRDNSKDVVSLELQHEKVRESVERLRFTFENTTDTNTELQFAWGPHRFKVPIEAFTSKKVDSNISKRIAEFDQQYEFYSDAARYFYDQGNYVVAKKYGERSVEMNEKFWNTHTLAKIYKETGEKDKALRMAKKSLELSEKENYKPYIDRNKKLISELK